MAKRWIIMGLACITALLSGGGCRRDTAVGGAMTTLSADAVSVRAQNITDSKMFDMASMNGYPVVLLTWATWNKPSLEALRTLNELVDSYEHRGLRAVAIVMDTDKSEVVKRTIEEMHIHFPVIYWTDISANLDFLKVRAIPSWVLTDRDHRVQQVAGGFMASAALQDAVECLIAPHVTD